MMIGICGKSGCGKSTLAKQIVKSHPNAVHLDIDKIGHRALTDETAKMKLISRYGKYIMTNNSIDRKKLSKIVFNSKEEMDFLTEVTWQYMQIEIDRFLEENKEKIIILDWLLLPKSKYFEKCDIRILLDIPYDIRKERAMLRDNISEEAFALREKSSIDYNHKDFHYIIEDSNEENIKRLVKLL